MSTTEQDAFLLDDVDVNFLHPWVCLIEEETMESNCIIAIQT
jgi:hypothetical protein